MVLKNQMAPKRKAAKQSLERSSSVGKDASEIPIDDGDAPPQSTTSKTPNKPAKVVKEKHSTPKVRNSYIFLEDCNDN